MVTHTKFDVENLMMTQVVADHTFLYIVTFILKGRKSLFHVLRKSQKKFSGHYDFREDERYVLVYLFPAPRHESQFKK